MQSYGDKTDKNKSMREATIAQRSSVQSSSCYSVHFESADSFVTRRRPSLARIGLFYSHYNANSVRANAQKCSKRNVLFFFCLFVCPLVQTENSPAVGGGRGRTLARQCHAMLHRCTFHHVCHHCKQQTPVRRGLEQPNLYRLTGDHARVATVNAGLIMASL